MKLIASITSSLILLINAQKTYQPINIEWDSIYNWIFLPENVQCATGWFGWLDFFLMTHGLKGC
jgi:hypothetical protein